MGYGDIESKVLTHGLGVGILNRDRYSYCYGCQAWSISIISACSQFPGAIHGVLHEIGVVKAEDSGSTVREAVCWAKGLAHGVGEVAYGIGDFRIINIDSLICNYMSLNDSRSVFAWVDQLDCWSDCFTARSRTTRQDVDIGEGYFGLCPDQSWVVSRDLEVCC